jgi:ubiquinone/menaquinone biosynthesis C-methylase UbiE
LRHLLTLFPHARTILEIGCGTGHFARWLDALGFETVGLDLSQAMLKEAAPLETRTLVQADAEELPFDSDAVDLAVLITTLEFTPKPSLTLMEAVRVARSGLLIGALNRRSRWGSSLRSKSGPVWDKAHLFTPSELIHLMRRTCEPHRIEIIWRTTLWPLWPGALPLPWGGFIGMAVRFDS